ncbi:MAG: hypothetical protein JO091_06230, partial [Acidobacteriaceae bacterium]|nr:hypothetical protein [Acidobacteriaceae bacterium]
QRRGLLYAGTEHGIYVSFDDGDSWQSLRLNLPDTQVSDLVINGDDLVIATHGRSFWVLDNLDILRQVQPSVSASALHLFAPDEAVRPFRSADIDYYLQKPAGKLTLEILDAGGKVVRTFVGSPDEEKRNKEKEEEAPEFAPPRTTPPGRNQGTNRFTWDLRYPGATVFEGEILWGARAEQGPMAVPGNYQVRVSANGQSQTAPLVVKLDPREHVTQAQLQDQFDLASKVRDQVSEADEMVIRIRDLNRQAKERAAKANDTTVSSAAASLRDKLSTIEEEIYQVRNRANEDPLNFPIKLNNQIAALARTIETGDNPPTEQDYEVFRILTAHLEAVRVKFHQALAVDLAQFNELLTSHKLPLISGGTASDHQ